MPVTGITNTLSKFVLTPISIHVSIVYLHFSSVNFHLFQANLWSYDSYGSVVFVCLCLKYPIVFFLLVLPWEKILPGRSTSDFSSLGTVGLGCTLDFLSWKMMDCYNDQESLKRDLYIYLIKLYIKLFIHIIYIYIYIYICIDISLFAYTTSIYWHMPSLKLPLDLAHICEWELSWLKSSSDLGFKVQMEGTNIRSFTEASCVVKMLKGWKCLYHEAEWFVSKTDQVYLAVHMLGRSS